MALKLGLNLGYWGIGPAGEDAVEVVQAAEAAGFESVWAAESYGSDVVSVLAWLAPQTKTIKLGAAIMQVPARPPAAAAMAGATIDKLSGGRFLFGFGPSGPQVSEGWYGVPYAKPWGRTREYIEVVREIVAREGKLDHQGQHYQLPLPGGEGKPLKLNFHPERNRIPVFVGAIGRKSVEMAAEICDGWIPIFFSVDAFEQTWGEHLEAGFAKGGRQRSDLEVSPSLQVAIDGDLEAAKSVVKAGLVLYFGGMGSRKTNFYVDLAHRFGFGEVADEVQRRFQDGDRGGRLRGDARRDRRGDLAGRHRGRGGGAGRALPRRRHRPPDRLSRPRRARPAAAHDPAPRRYGGRQCTGLTGCHKVRRRR